MALKPLVLLPGMLCDAGFWRAQIGGLGDIADVQVASYRLAHDFDTMAEVVLARAPSHFALAGHSMGGRVALEIWRRAPERVDALALLATDYRGHASAADRAAEAARRDAILAQGPARFAPDWAKQIVAPENAVCVPEVVEMMLRQPDGALAAQTLAGLNRRDHADVLPTISCPTLVCAGWDDTLRPVAVHRDMAALIPESRLVTIAQCGHMVAMEQPQAVTVVLRDWLGVGTSH